MKIIFILLITTQIFYAQELDIQTNFILPGVIRSKPGFSGEELANFDKGDDCLVIGYGGYNYYKVKTEKAIGFVRYDFLNVTYEMENFAKAFETERKLKKAEEKKQKEQEAKESLEKAKLERIAKSKADRLRELKEIEDKKELKKKSDSLQILDMRKKCHYVRNEIDKYEKIKVVEIEYYPVKSNDELFFPHQLSVIHDLSIKLMKYGGQTFIYFHLNEDLGCASGYRSSRSSVKVYLQNDDIITFYHNDDTDCSEFTLRGSLSENEIIRLKKAKIESIRLEGTKYYKDIDAIDYKDFFIDKLKCLNN